jgi:beta-galactosidase
MKSLLLSAFLLCSCWLCGAQRVSVDLSEGWRFIKQDVAPDAPWDSWESVRVPHTWNAIDGQNGTAADPDYPAGYYRGPAWYADKLDLPPAWKNKRVFIRFEAASLVATVYLNGRLIGEHRGGFTAFCFELTPYLNFGGQNVLRVRVDNSINPDVPPLRGDFTVCGGIYRPAHLLALDSTCITPLDFASPGVYLTEREVNATEATVEVEAKISNGMTNSSNLEVETELADARGKSILKKRETISVPADATTNCILTFDVEKPHLWSGRADPYLYSVAVRLRRDGKVVDEVTQPLGLRTVQIDPQRGFLLNGKPYPIHGVTRHQERRDQGWALSDADHDQDHQMILDIGATAIRLAHYPQSDFFVGMCDRSGLLVWEEIPLVDQVNDTPAFRANARQQLTEMLLQYRNHPAAVCWGLFNELYQYSKTDPPEAMVAGLKQLAREMDSMRIIVAASDKIERTNLNLIPDWIAFNIYPGWYPSSHGDFAAIVDRLSASVGNKRIGISEYGAGANIHQHEEGEVKPPKTNGPWHPEEWQSLVHEHDWSQARDNPHLWGTFLWNMFDFASDNRNEGDNPGVNDKGLVTEDRKVKKDAFFFYQANWTTAPMVYITSRRMTPRKLAETEIKLYSNCKQVELSLNGESMGTRPPDSLKVLKWENVQLRPGTNLVEAIGRTEAGVVRDSCEWVFETPTPSP